MRAARLLQILLILQNRGRQTSVQLGEELEVTPRTILRDVDAMTEAGLPIIVHQGNRGGIELGFNYRARLTGLTTDEARALGLILGAANPMTRAIGLDHAAALAKAKLIESFPDTTRAHVVEMMSRFTVVQNDPIDDPRIRALALAIQAGTIVRLCFGSKAEQVIHPVAMEMNKTNWRVYDAQSERWVAQDNWGRLNISAKRFVTG
ncbi:MAG: HTH domain-containing protein [Sulfitobacter sp.]